MFEYRNVFDFRVGEVHGSKVLTAIVDYARLLQSNYSMSPSGFIINEKYQVVQEIDISKTYNMHEFNIVDNNRIIIATRAVVAADLADMGMPNRTIRVISGGFREWDITTGKNVLEWHTIDHISLADSMMEMPSELHRIWDSFHLNSVTKDARGDYLVSLRHTSTLYKVSGKDGSIIWRLGGKFSNFQQNFNFSGQHHARILAEDDTGMTITLFDNAADDTGIQANTADASSMQVIKIYDREEPRRAKLLAQYVRPDGQLTDKRGSAQILETGNAFICWSVNGYISEHTADGRIVLEASFLNDRFSTYRAYHVADWVGRPAEPPALMSYAHTGGSLKTLPSTVLYVSWNGATEVASWTFYGASSVGGSDNTFQKLGSVSKVSFESSIAVDGYWPHTYAEAYDAHGNLLGTSEVKVTVLPEQAEGQFERDDDSSGTHTFSASLSVSEGALTLHASKPVAGFSTFVAVFCMLYTAVSLSLRAWERWRPRSRRHPYRGLPHHEKTLSEDETNALCKYPDVRSENDEEENDDDEFGQ
jgi:Arylsulfotransferase (ASST)